MQSSIPRSEKGRGIHMKSFRCMICGYIHIGYNPPEKCPICGADASEFEPYEPEAVSVGKPVFSFRCINCEYIHEGTEAPETCPVCGMKKDSFEPYTRAVEGSSTTDHLRIVIIGGGIAGLSAAEEVRKHSDSADITLVSTEIQLPYYRLNLTRYLAGEADRADLSIHPEHWYRDNRIGLMLGKEATDIDKEQKHVRLNDGTVLAYDRLLVAMGAHPFVPPLPGTHLENVLTVRHLEDADEILDKMKGIRSCICIGGGVLGLETAGALAKSGVSVTLLEGSDWLMPRQLNQKGAMLLKNYLRGIGIEVRENCRTAEILGDRRCEGVLLQSGEVLKGDMVIITTGVRPNTHLARKAGMEVDKGLVADHHLRTTDPNIYAAGDVAEHYGTLYGLWNVAQFQGRVAAMNMLGIATQFGGIPRSNTLKVLGLEMFSVGDFTPSDASYQQYEAEGENSYVSLVLRDGRMTGGIVIGDRMLAVKVKQAVEKGTGFPYEHYHDFGSIVKYLAQNA
jgi:nitrite reductase (NADH) large subunit